MSAISRPTPGFDLDHLHAVCDSALHTAGRDPRPVDVRATLGGVYIAAPDEPGRLAVMPALRRVGYFASPSDAPAATERDAEWIRVDGWYQDALERRFDGLTVAAHRLTRDLPDNVGHAIDTYATMCDLTDLDAPKWRAAAQLRTQLRDQATATTGPHAPYDRDRPPEDPLLARLLDRVRTQEHRVDDLISRTWFTALNGIERYTSVVHGHPPTIARDHTIAAALDANADQDRRDTAITVMQWAREEGHGDAVAYAHWYAHTYGTSEDGPDPADAYDTWRQRTELPTADDHPTAIAAHDLPEPTTPTQMAIDIPAPGADHRTNERNTTPGRRAS